MGTTLLVVPKFHGVLKLEIVGPNLLRLLIRFVNYVMAKNRGVAAAILA